MRTILAFLVLTSAAVGVTRPPIEYFDPLRPVYVQGPDRLAQISFPLILRIGLEEKQEAVTLTCPKPFRIDYAGQSVPCAAQERWTFKLRSGKPAEIEYAASVGTYHWGDRAVADEQVAAWKARGYANARLAVRGALMQNQGGTVHDNREYTVLVSASQDPAETDKVLEKLRAEGARPFVIEKLLTQPEGIIELTGPGNRAIVSRGPFEVLCDDRVRVFQVEHDIGYPFHGREDREYAGSILLMVDRWGKLVVINRIEMERYLRGVVPCEIESDAPLEAQKTQAVSARGETLAGYGVRHPADPYDFEASQKDQQYAGLLKETALATQAVELTRGQVLRAGDKIVETVYAANCGGHTEDNDIVWSSPANPHLRAVADAPPGLVPSPVTEASLETYLNGSPDAYCRDPRNIPTNKYRWKTTLTADEVDKLVAAKGHKVGKVLALNPVTRGRSGRLRALEVVGGAGRVKVDKELPIRQLLGGLRSALFVVKPGAAQGQRPSSWTFVGGGWGHGVGMCQMGARGMARAGKDYVQILTHYFAATALADLY